MLASLDQGLAAARVATHARYLNEGRGGAGATPVSASTSTSTAPVTATAASSTDGGARVLAEAGHEARHGGGPAGKGRLKGAS